MKYLTLSIALILVSLATGCNTISGAGKDVKTVGESIEKVAEDTKDEIKD